MNWCDDRLENKSARVQSPGQGECHSEEASLLLEAGIISGTEFLETDFSGQIHLGQIPIN